MASQQLKMCFKVAIILMGILPQVMANTCELGHYISQGQHGINCIDCVTCPPGLGANVPCNTVIYPGTNIACIKCVRGKTFSSGNDEKLCQPCNSSTCQRNEKWVGKCNLKEDNTQCTGICVKDYYWSKNRTEPCQPCKGTTCHHNEVVVGMCTLKEDNTQCNGTCVKGYYWSTNRTEPCQPLMTDGGPLSDESPLSVIMIVVISIGSFIALIIIIFLVRWCLKKVHQLTSKYEPCRKVDNVERGDSSHTDITCASLNDESTNANNEAELDTQPNNNVIQESEPPSKCPDISVDQSPFSRLDSNDRASSSLNRTPDSTPTLNHKPSSSIELETPLLLDTPDSTPTPKRKESSSRDQQDLRRKVFLRNLTVPLTDISVHQSPFSRLDSNDRASSALNRTPDSTPTFNHKPSSSIELETPLLLDTPDSTPTPKRKESSSRDQQDPPVECFIMDELFSGNAELNPRHEAPVSLSTPGGTPTPKRRESSSTDEQDLRRKALSTKRSAPSTECKVETHRIDRMNPEIYRRLCQRLDLDLTIGDNYETLGSHLGYNKLDIDIARNQKKESPSSILLGGWGQKCSGNTVLALEKIVQEKMKRFDVLEKLEEELKLQRDQCNCGNCSEIPLSVEKTDT